MCEHYAIIKQTKNLLYKLNTKKLFNNNSKYNLD